MCWMMHAMDHSTQDAGTGHSHSLGGESLLEILKRRYALGEITREQLQEMKIVLGLSGEAPRAEAAHH
jgi:uncharacterized membrane protein